MTSSNSWYRSNLWRWKGNREYTKTGYESAAALFDYTDLDVDCTGRHYMITGCNSGIGYEMAKEVARRGGVIHMVCRNPVAAKEARTNIITTTGNDKIHLHTLDLSCPRFVTRWARDFVASDNQLHVLINNAGCMVHERRIDEDGIETNFAVNTLAIHILTMTMLPLLQRSADARVVTVSSAGMLTVKLDPYDLMHAHMDPWNGALVYSQNKRQEIIMTLHYAMKYDKVHFSVMHPGWADTTAVRTSMPAFYEAMKDVLRTASMGADTAVWLALSKAAIKHPSGLFFQDRVPVSPHLPLAWTRSSQQDEEVFINAIDEFYTKFSSELTPLTSSPRPPTAKVIDNKSENILEEEIVKIENLNNNTGDTINKSEEKQQQIEDNSSEVKSVATTEVVDDKSEKNLEEEKNKKEDINNISEDVIKKSEENHQKLEDISSDVKNIELNDTAISETESITKVDDESEKNLEEEKVKKENTNNISEDVIMRSEKNDQNKEDSSIEDKNKTESTTLIDILTKQPEENSSLSNGLIPEVKEENSSLSNGLIPEVNNKVSEIKSSVEANLKSVLTKVEEKVDNVTIDKEEENFEIKETINVTL